ncbi:MAG: repeat protein [Bacteroidetes bacterium]|nr:repeat protein [Bacteroidota bacterium]
MKKIITLWLIIISSSLSGQTNYYPFGFEQEQTISVLDSQNNPVQDPWMGGINSIKFSSIDINNDGFKDLLGFEKHGNRIVPLIWNNTLHVYQYAPQYMHLFPKLHDWVILKDYDFDGKEDIFTYGLASIEVYRQTSSNPLQFSLVTDQLQSFYYNGNVNIFTSPDDYIAIEDFDQDGDLDILNFWILGKFVHLQKNISMELFGNPDSLIYVLGDECWGAFSEGADNNTITLFSHCQTKEWDPLNEPTRHIGSSLQAFKFGQDTLFNLLVGDVDYPELIYLKNGGTKDSALMVSQTTLFPNNIDPIQLYSMPAISYEDLDHDGIKEIIASPSDPSLLKSEDHNSVWVYKYNTQNQQFELQTKSFIQSQTIDVGSGAYPILYDWNQDGLQDLFVANYGSYDSSQYVNGVLQSYYSSSISYFQNVGTLNNPTFKLITNDFGNLKSRKYIALYPTFADFDQNGTTDMLCGKHDGKLILFYNNNLTGLLPEFGDSVPNFQNITVSNFSTPQLFDIDQDGDLDLMIGNRRGQIAYYQNSDNNFTFQLITGTLGEVDVRDISNSYFGYSVPQFFRINNTTYLFCASEQGEVFVYKNIDGNLNGVFTRDYSLVKTLQNSPYLIDEGIRCGVAAADVNNDQLIDLIVGNWAGGVTYFKGSAPIQVSVKENVNKIIIYPNPAHDQFVIQFQNGDPFTGTIYSVMGQFIKIIEGSGSETTIYCNDLTNGIYILHIEINGEIITKKLLIERQIW